VDSNSDSFTIGGEEIGSGGIIFGIFIFIIIIVIMIKAFGGGGGKTERNDQGNASLNNEYQHQEAAKIRQLHLCDLCKKCPIIGVFVVLRKERPVDCWHIKDCALTALIPNLKKSLYVLVILQ